MTAYVFLGPTLSLADARAELDAIYLPPVSQGDVYRVALQRPKAIGIVDGYFQHVPAVWHKEVLFAMEHGIHVYGASSMGALRAAELHPFGMVGVGKIFEDFRDGVLEDDDEVAVSHGPADSGYRAMNEAMVNVRATLARAVADGIVSEPSRGVLESIAKHVFYPERAWPVVLQRATGNGVSRAEINALRAWLPKNRVDQKREDALTMLRRLRAELGQGADLAPKQVRYRLEYTTFWDELVQSAGVSVSSSDASGPDVTNDAILDELRLEGARWFQARDAALVRGLTLRVAKHEGHRLDDDARRKYALAFRSERGLANEEELDAWLDANMLPRASFEDLVEEEALLQLVVWRALQTVADSFLIIFV